MEQASKKTSARLFPGDSLKEKLINEFRDFFFGAVFRKEFFLMVSYSMLMVISLLIAEDQNFFDFSSTKINFALFELGLYFFLSDFCKRKKLFTGHWQFIADCFFYTLLMLQVIVMTGGYASPIAFTLLFLTAISAPLYGTLIETLIFVSIIAVAYSSLEIIQYHTVTVTFYFHLLEGAAMIVAATIVKFSLNAFAEKTEEVKRVNEKLAVLNQDIDQYNAKLELAVKEKTKELQSALVNMQANEEELKKQKTAILNILEDMDTERANTLIEKEKLSRILQSIGDAVFVVDRDRKVIIFNHVAEMVSGFLAGEVVGKKYDKIIRFVDEREHKPNQTVEAVFTLGKIQEFTSGTILISKDGKEIPVSDSAAPILDANGQVAGCIVVFRDVTREREIDRQKTEFVSVASHQLRTPLTSIKWFLEMLIDGDLGKLSTEQIDTLKQVFASNERMIDLVNRLLNVSRIESGRVKVEPKPTDLNDLIKGVITEITPLAKQLEQKVEVKISDSPVINIDQKLIREVFVNYMSNAIKYTPHGGKIVLSVKQDGQELIVAVKDDGIGIPNDQQSKIFHKFFRAENAVARETEGTGMGLYVCKSIIDLSGGRTWFDSKLDKGTTFYFSLPLSGSPRIKGEKSLI